MSKGDSIGLQKVNGNKGSNYSVEDGSPGPPYDPHAHRELANPTTDRETLIHILKGSLGTGILAMPNAFYNSGLIVGTIATFVIGFICTYCLHVLVRSQYELCKRKKVPILSYPETMRVALQQGPSCLKPFANISVPIVDGFLIIYQLGICVCYIMFVATSIKQVADIYATPLDVRIHMLIILVPLMLITYIRNLKLLAPFSQLANIITFIGIGITLYYIFDDLPAINSVPYVGVLRNFVLYMGTTLFALEAVGVILALENNMKTPKSFGGYTGVLNQGMVVIVILYVLVGFFGYVKYGSDALGSVTLNLPKTDILAQIVKLIFAVAIFVTYALQCYVPVDIVWNTYMKKHITSKELFWEYFLRTTAVLITFVLAVAVPRLELFISLFGAFCLSALGIAFPAIIEICVMWPDNLGTCYYILFRNFLLILFGIAGLLVGTYTSISDIITSFQ
ncbi:hypothetical protein LSTR_LSTR003372 [Laodelphax striatellus]|uniref:Amino acid transporter transmembrane domain-containing protein n=1 Tax=Laodelphax striatellus TaxID=195883 RepID=A0A482X595_LAOST|nr:hypothetical protein LSTR_LSTR003372 [Laodelphax striatellus]